MFKLKGQSSRSQRKVMYQQQKRYGYVQRLQTWHGVVIKAGKDMAWLGWPQVAMHSQLPRFLQCESKKVAPLKLLAIFSLRLSIFRGNFADLLPVYIHTYLPILVDLS